MSQIFNNKENLINMYLIISTVIMFYLLYRDLTRKEGFGQTEDINAAINTRYGADVEAIRNLSDLATKLTTGGLTVPGNVKISGNLQLDGIINVGSKFPDAPTYGAGIGPGNGDYASFDTYNCELRSWWGTGFRDLAHNKTNIVIDHRTGMIHCKGIKIYDSNTSLSYGFLPTGAYMIDATIGAAESAGWQFNIGSSIQWYGLYDMNDRDKYYIVLPGYKLIVTEGDFSNQWRKLVMDNTDGTEIKGYKCSVGNADLTNQGSSCKLFYKNHLHGGTPTEIPYLPGHRVEQCRLEARHVRQLAELLTPTLG